MALASGSNQPLRRTSMHLVGCRPLLSPSIQELAMTRTIRLPRLSRRSLCLAAAAAATGLAAGSAFAADPIKIGLVTALSGQSALAGEAITRGLTVAIDEINAK